jgi:hypothetical protein
MALATSASLKEMLASRSFAHRELAKQSGHENQRGGKDESPRQLSALTTGGVLLEIADVCPGPGSGDHDVHQR